MTEAKTDERPRALISWSSGKDCAWALHRMQQTGDFELAGLLTTINEHFDRVAMHGTREALLQAQADAAGLPLWPVPLPWPCANEVYQQRMAVAIDRARDAGITHIVFGDLHLADVRQYREQQLQGTGITPLFPLWGEDTQALAASMIAGGLRATVVCVDPEQLNPGFAGRAFDQPFLDDLPQGVDACGERGEFHTFCHAGPMFRQPVQVTRGETVTRDGFVYTDLRPA